jgi:cob(I)alamin adenosyltransferase
MEKRGIVHLYTGEGGGKTTMALGLAMREIGHAHRVIIVQFLKGRKDVGEYKIAERLKPNLQIAQFGTERFVDLKSPSTEDKELARKGIAFAKEALAKKPHLLVLDEINLAAAYGLVDVQDVLQLLENIPDETWVVLTGRRAPEALKRRADIVTVVEDAKRREMPAHEGIEY